MTAHFKVALVGVDFDSDEERAEYEKAAKEGGSARTWLTSHGWAVEDPFGEFMKEVAKLAEQAPIHNGQGNQYTAVGHARDYLPSFSHSENSSLTPPRRTRRWGTGPRSEGRL